MVMALHQQGWRVVLDVVYNHTFRAGPHDRCGALPMTLENAQQTAALFCRAPSWLVSLRLQHAQGQSTGWLHDLRP